MKQKIVLQSHFFVKKKTTIGTRCMCSLTWCTQKADNLAQQSYARTHTHTYRLMDAEQLQAPLHCEAVCWTQTVCARSRFSMCDTHSSTRSRSQPLCPLWRPGFSPSSLHNSPHLPSERSSLRTCGLGLLEEATNQWLMLGSITHLLRDESHGTAALCHFSLRPAKKTVAGSFCFDSSLS